MLRRASTSCDRNYDSSSNDESEHQTNQKNFALNLSISRHSTPILKKPACILKRARSVSTIAKNVSFDLGRNEKFYYDAPPNSQDENSRKESVAQDNSNTHSGAERSDDAHSSTVNSTQSNSQDVNSPEESVGQDNSETHSGAERSNDAHASTANLDQSNSQDENSLEESVGQNMSDIHSETSGNERNDGACATTEHPAESKSEKNKIQSKCEYKSAR